jgi:hypothetical protein
VEVGGGLAGARRADARGRALVSPLTQRLRKSASQIDHRSTAHPSPLVCAIDWRLACGRWG